MSGGCAKSRIMTKPDLVPITELSSDLFNDINKRLAKSGMEVLGVFHLDGEEALSFTGSTNEVVGLMVASPGRDMWQVFTDSEHYNGQLPNPMDHWTASVLGEIAMDVGAGLALPFDRPYPPFQAWAKRATHLSNSPLGVLVHREYGLWFGLRGVMFVKVNVENQQLDKLIQQLVIDNHPCDACIDKPCLSVCPVKAFNNDGLDVRACYSYLEETTKSGTEPDCLEKGCAARAACPVGADYIYCTEQLRFHMNSYYSNRV